MCWCHIGDAVLLFKDDGIANQNRSVCLRNQFVIQKSVNSIPRFKKALCKKSDANTRNCESMFPSK